MKCLVLLAFSFSFAAHAGSFTSNPIGACQQLSRAPNARVLVIAAEGRGEYDDAHADAIFNYVGQRKTGMIPGVLPRLQKTGILTDGLLFPLAQSFGDRVDIVSFDLDSINPQPFNNADICAQIWMRNSRRKVVLIGHSHGASRVANLAGVLAEQGLVVNTLITIDGLLIDGGTIMRPANVGTLLNFYQTKGAGDPSVFELPGLSVYRGQPIATADNANQLVTDVSGHFTITASRTVITAVEGRIEKLVGPAQVAAAR